MRMTTGSRRRVAGAGAHARLCAEAGSGTDGRAWARAGVKLGGRGQAGVRAGGGVAARAVWCIFAVQAGLGLPAFAAGSPRSGADVPPGFAGLSATTAGGFMENRGQEDAEVLFRADGARGAVFLTRSAIVLDLRTPASGRPLEEPGQVPGSWRGRRVPGSAGEGQVSRSVGERRISGRVIRLAFAGGDPSPRLATSPEEGASYNFYRGSSPSEWIEGVRSFSVVRYEDLWAGVDLVCSFSHGELAIKAEAEDGASTEAARLVCQGLDSVLAASPVSAESERDDPGRLLWSTYLGGRGEDHAWSLALDEHGAPIVTGVTFSSDFPTTPGSYDSTYAGFGDVFVSKLDPSGQRLIWSTFLGGTAANFDYGYGVSAGKDGDAFVTGYTWSEDFPVTPGAYDTTHDPGVDAFVTRLEGQDGSMVWSTFLGGNAHDIGYSIAASSSGDVIAAGRTGSSDFPTTPGSYDPYPNGEEDAFVTALAGSGDALRWSTLIGGSAYDAAAEVRLDPSGAIFLCGATASKDYPGGSYAGGLYDVLVSKLSGDGSSLWWSRTLGGGSYEFGNGLAIDAAGDVLLCGATGSDDFPATPGAFDLDYNGNDDAWVARLSGANGDLAWATYLGGSAPFYETAFGVAPRPGGGVAVAGSTPSADFPVTPDAFDTSHNGMGDVFVAAFDADGSRLEWASFLGGGAEDYAWDLEIGEGDEALIVGAAGPDGFPSTPGSYDPSYNGDALDGFLARVRLGQDPSALGVTPASGGPVPLRIFPQPLPSARAGAWLEFTLPRAAEVRLELVDVTGRVRARQRAGHLAPGEHRIFWDPQDGAERGRIAAGRYLLRLNAGPRPDTKTGSVETRVAPLVILR